ncbi:MAG: aldehyde dehydrogenase family protein, partial [Alteromonadaceae bacterium]|nr:aldehyde dehydrogenase family protein [Alteromonadaceae bacterium]
MSDVLENKSIITVVNPQDGSYVGEVESCSADDALTAVDTAVNAFEESKKLPAHVRMSVLNQVADDLFQQKELFAQVIAREGIKTINEA